MLAFQKACTDVAVAQWLLSLGAVHMHARRDGAFRWACQNGHLAVAQWLITLSGVNIHAFHDYAFRAACSKGHVQVAQWLFFLGGVDSHILDDHAFCSACANGHLALGRWLIAQEPEWAWPAQAMRALQVWSPARDAWMRAVKAASRVAQ